MNNQILHDIFDPKTLEAHPDEWGVAIHAASPDAIGFATTLTPAVIRQAIAKKVNLLVTHHDAWDFMLEEKTLSHELLAEHHISHIWCHTPLDAADFGTSAALLGVFDCKLIGTIAEGDGRVGELPKALGLPDVITLLNERLSEIPCRMVDANRPVSRIGVVTGAGSRIAYLVEALALEADLFITGETSLYLLEYASFRNISALIYSHNYSELPGTQNLAERVASQLGIQNIIRLDEPHY